MSWIPCNRFQRLNHRGVFVPRPAEKLCHIVLYERQHEVWVCFRKIADAGLIPAVLKCVDGYSGTNYFLREIGKPAAGEESQRIHYSV